MKESGDPFSNHWSPIEDTPNLGGVRPWYPKRSCFGDSKDIKPEKRNQNCSTGVLDLPKEGGGC